MDVENEKSSCDIWNYLLKSPFDASEFPVVIQNLQPFSHHVCLTPTSPQAENFGQYYWPPGCHPCPDFEYSDFKLLPPIYYRGWRFCSSSSGYHPNPSTTSSVPRRELLKHPAADTLWAVLLTALWQDDTLRDLNLNSPKPRYSPLPNEF